MVVVIGGLGCGGDVCNVVIKYYELKIPQYIYIYIYIYWVKIFFFKLMIFRG
jgi:hypothetical protein